MTSCAGHDRQVLRYLSDSEKQQNIPSPHYLYDQLSCALRQLETKAFPSDWRMSALLDGPLSFAKAADAAVPFVPAGLSVVRSIPSVPVTEERKPFIETSPRAVLLEPTGVARANTAPSAETPLGTVKNNWNKNHAHQTVLQQHIDFFDPDHDGIIWPLDTFWGLRRLGFNILLCVLSILIIHGNFSYPTLPGWIPDPFFRIYSQNIHKDKHGSDTGAYDTEGRFVPQSFENIFSKYAEGRDYVTVADVSRVLKGQRCLADPFGWFGAFFEWLVTYILLWPKDGRMKKEDIRGVYDGSIFYTIAASRTKKE
jgi:hypothetical protein